MTRTRASAKAAGTRFESEITAYLAAHLPTGEFIERRRLGGALDAGDISGVRTIRGERVAVEVKNTVRTDLAGWVKEAAIEATNDNAALGVVIAKRHGVGDPAEQYVHMRVRDLVILLGGAP